jgi:hypothetical protein
LVVKVKKTTMPKKNIDLDYAKRFKQALIDYGGGLTELQISLLLAQAANESGGFKHVHALSEYNLTGIKYNSSLKKVATPSKVFRAPADEDPHGIMQPYARFESMAKFMDGYLHYTNLMKMRAGNHVGAPLQATNLVDFNHRLALNGYYDTGPKHRDGEAIYRRNLIAWSHEFQQLGLVDSNPILNNALFGNGDTHGGQAGNRIANFVEARQNNPENITAGWWNLSTLPYNDNIQNNNPNTANKKRQPAGFTASEIINGAKALAIAMPPLAPGALAISAGIEAAGKIAAKAKELSKQKTAANRARQRYGNTSAPINENISELQDVKNIWSPGAFNTLPVAPPVIDTMRVLPAINPVDSLPYPSDTINTNRINDFYQNYKPLLPVNDTMGEPANTPNTAYPIDSTGLPGKAKLKQTNGSTASPVGKNAITINLNRGMIENFTVNVKDAKEGIEKLNPHCSLAG